MSSETMGTAEGVRSRTFAHVGELDRHCWGLVCGWAERSTVGVARDGLDYAELLRKRLMPRVASALREGLERPPWLTAELESLAARPRRGSGVSESQSAGRSTRLRQLITAATRLARSYRYRTPPRSCLFLANVLERWDRTLFSLGRRYRFVITGRSPLRALKNHPWVTKADVRARLHDGDESFAASVIDELGRILLREGVALSEDDLTLLRSDLVDIILIRRIAEAEFEAVRPSGILMATDNCPPNLVYVLLARSRGIPTLMMQHGLDCDLYVYDQAVASHHALWGEARRTRYGNQSPSWNPVTCITGNPEWDTLKANSTMLDPHRGDWGWLTRPHALSHCYVPSRHPAEGLAIFETLLDCLDRHPERRLVVRAHPADHPELYAERAVTRGMADRVELHRGDLSKFFDRVSVIITEDSTAGLDAFLRGRVVVHAHYAMSPPVVPFVEYGAALPGFSPAELSKSLDRCTRLSLAEKAALGAGVGEFISDHAGPGDGAAGARWAAFVRDVVGG